MKKTLFLTAILGLVLCFCGCNKGDKEEVISTVPSTNNPNVIVDSSLNTFSPMKFGSTH